MNYEQVQELIQQIDQSSLREFELKNADIDLRMSKNEHALVEPVTQSMESSKETHQESGLFDQDKNQTVSHPTFSDETSSIAESVLEEGHTINSPIVGVLYLSPGPDEPLFKQPGDLVKVGDTLCIVEAMKVMNEIKSDVNGTLINVFAEDNSAVEYNQPLFSIQLEE